MAMVKRWTTPLDTPPLRSDWWPVSAQWPGGDSRPLLLPSPPNNTPPLTPPHPTPLSPLTPFPPPLARRRLARPTFSNYAHGERERWSWTPPPPPPPPPLANYVDFVMWQVFFVLFFL